MNPARWRAWPLTLAWLVLAGAPALWLAPVLLGLAPAHGQADYYLLHGDAWPLGAITLAFLILPFLPAAGLGRRLRPGLVSRRRIWLLAGLVAAAAAAGVFVVFAGFPLSRDEDMAAFGAAIFAHGQAWAPVPSAWRDYAAALEPEFVRVSAGVRFWQPAYLPVDAALRALAGPAAFLVNPALAGASVLLVFTIGRRLWPERPALAAGAAVLLATSSQLLVAAMTPYAMTAQLAFNLAWLALHLRGGRAGHGSALALGFLACGLHQLAFHPLFAAPFVLELWLARRWRLAALYSLAYAWIGLFWLEWAPLTLALAGGHPAGAAGAAGLPGQVAALASATHQPTTRLMAENLVRFLTWQNLLLAPLAALGFLPALRAGGPLRALALGVVLTTIVVAMLMPYQGYGWGYRYWHGLLGSLALIGMGAWARLTRGLPADGLAASRGVFAGAAALSLLVLFPIQAARARAFVLPYARAFAAIRAAPAEIVLVDPRGGWYDNDLVRNDPYLRNRPLVLRAPSLWAGQLRDLCARYSLAVMDAGDAERFGVRGLPGRWAPAAERAALGLPARCGPARSPVVEIAPAEAAP